MKRMILLISFVAGTICQALVAGDDSFVRQNVSPEWMRHHKAIESEFEKLGDHPWAGSYYFGDGLSVNLSLTLSPKNGFVEIHRGCLGVYGTRIGDVLVTERGSVRLIDSKDHKEEEFVPVRWGERRYLLPVDRLLSFCQAASVGRHPRRRAQLNARFLASGDHEKPATGPPIIPDAFQPLLLATPVQVGVVSVEGNGNITIDSGRAEGVIPGVAFRVLEPKDVCANCRLRVVKVDDHSAIVQLDKQPSASIPKRTWKLTTELATP